MNYRIFALGVLIAAATPGCDLREVAPPDVTYKEAPDEVRRMAITLDIPPPHLGVDGVDAIYIIENPDCVPVDETIALGGIRPTFEETLAVNLAKLADGSYQADVPVRPIKPQDYYGLGACHWELGAVRVRMDAGYALRAETRSSWLDYAPVKLFCPRGSHPGVAFERCMYSSSMNGEDPDIYFAVTLGYVGEEAKPASLPSAQDLPQPVN